MMWIDSNSCPESFHDFERDDDGELIAVHCDGSPCELMEFDLVTLAEGDKQ